MLTDPIADFLNRLKNASRAQRETLTVRSSGTIKSIAKVLAGHQFILSTEEHEEGAKKELTITLNPERRELEVRRISKPGQRIYVGHKELKRVKSGLGLALISTSQGILTSEEAKAKKIGGEYICEIS